MRYVVVNEATGKVFETGNCASLEHATPALGTIMIEFPHPGDPFRYRFDGTELVLKDDTVKVTLSLTKESVDFFKKEAKNYHTQYQKMIRNLLDKYAHQHKSKKRKGR